MHCIHISLPVFLVLDEDWYHSEDPVKSGVTFYAKVTIILYVRVCMK